MVFVYWMKSVGLLALVFATAGSVGLAMFAPSSPIAGDRPVASVAAPADNRFRVMMTEGPTVEVVAISTLPTGPDTWWKPDGTRLAEPPVDPIDARLTARDAEVARVVLVRASGIKNDDLFRWLPIGTASYWGGAPRKDGQRVPGLEYYAATFPRDRADCGIEARIATGPWKTEVANDGGGGTGLFHNGHKFCFGKARLSTIRGRSMTVMAVAHNFFGQDRRLVAIDQEGKDHPAVAYSMGSDGDKKWMIDLIDGEFALLPEQIREYQVQFRPIQESRIEAIPLNPRPDDRSTPVPTDRKPAIAPEGTNP